MTQAYYDVLETQELVKVGEEILARSQENTARTQAFVDAGILIEADVATAQVREAIDEQSLLNDQNAHVIARATLPQLMGLDPGTLILVAPDTDYQRYLETGKIDVIEISVEEAIQRAFENRPEFKEMQSRIKQFEWGLTLEKLDRWPRLNAEYNYDVNLDDYLRERKNFKNFQSWDVTATLSFPLFDGGVTKRRVAEAELVLEQTRGDASELERSVALEVRQAYLNLKRAEKAVAISNTQVRNAQVSLEVIRGRFEQELAILLELLDAQTGLAQALTSQVRAFYDYKITQTALPTCNGRITVKRRKKVVIIGVVVVVVLTVGTIAVRGLTGKKKEDGDEKVEVVRRGEFLEKVREAGNLESLVSVEVRSNVEGEIEDLFVKVGEFVEKGQKLIQIDDQQIREQQEQAKANRDARSAQFKQAKLRINMTEKTAGEP